MSTKFGASTERVEEIDEVGAENQQLPIMKSEVAIRCAKSAILLSSLKQQQQRNSPKHSTIDEEDVEKLKKELVKERLKNKKMSTCSFVELFLQIALLFSLWTLSLLIAFNFLS